MITIAILSQKGGTGKTTLTTHLGVAAQDAGFKTLIFDLDEQGSAYKWFEKRKALPEGQGGPLLVPYVHHTQPLQLENQINRKHGADLVLIDTPPQTDRAAFRAAELADLVIVTCRATPVDLDVIPNTLRVCTMAHRQPLIVFTQIEPKGTRHREAGEAIRRLSLDVCPYGTGKRVAYYDGMLEGKTALEFEPQGKAAAEVRLLFAYIAKRLALSHDSQKEYHVEKKAV